LTTIYHRDTFAFKQNYQEMNQNVMICAACGTQYHADEIKNGHCKICDDDRQYVPESGQAWVSPNELKRDHAVQIMPVSDNLVSLTIVPSFAIGQRAFLVLSAGGNVLWDCIPLLDEATEAFINSRGGIRAIAISHPHYYSNAQEWAAKFNCPVFIHKKDKEWAPEFEDLILWEGREKVFWEGIKIINIGGHFPGSCVLHVPDLPGGGTVLCSDSLYISRNKEHVSVMHSYPNNIPVPNPEIERIAQVLVGYEFDKMYGAFSYQQVLSGVNCLLHRSIERYRSAGNIA
jgi:hypothetical protein